MGTRRYPKISGLHFTPRTISFKMDGKRVTDRVRINSRVPMVGHFNLHKPVVRVDRKIRSPAERRSIELHEAVEREERRRGLRPHQAHVIAERTERRMARRTGANMRKEGRHVEKVFRKNARRGERRRR
jgi:hypothetical protein